MRMGKARARDGKVVIVVALPNREGNLYLVLYWGDRSPTKPVKLNLT